MTISLRSAAALAGVLAFGDHAASAASFAHSMTVSGEAHGSTGPFACATSGPQASVSHFFGQGVGLPTEGYAGCNLAGGIQDASKPAGGLVTTHQDVTHAFNGGLNMGAADGKSDAGLTLGASASDSLTGSATFDPFSFAASEAAGLWTDTLNFGGAGMGFVQFGFSIDGTASVTGNGQAITLLRYQFDSGPIFTAFSGGVTLATGGYAFNPTGPDGFSGFATTATSVTGGGTALSFVTPVDLSQAFDLTLGLYTAAYAFPGGAVTNDFLHTAKITEISVWDAHMNPLDVHFTSSDGVVYDANGAHAATTGVPEPLTWTALVLGFGLLGAAVRRRRAAAGLRDLGSTTL